MMVEDFHREFEEMVEALDRQHRSRVRRLLTSARWSTLEAWAWTRWAWERRRPWWLFWGAAHETPLHDPAHYAKDHLDLLAGMMAAAGAVARQIGEALAGPLQQMAQAIDTIGGALLDWWANLPPETREILAAMSEEQPAP